MYLGGFECVLSKTHFGFCVIVSKLHKRGKLNWVCRVFFFSSEGLHVGMRHRNAAKDDLPANSFLYVYEFYM